MDLTFLTQCAYLTVSVLLTIWVATTLSRNGGVFLKDVFDGNEDLSRSVNHLLVVGFYLVNLGFVCLALRSGLRVGTAPESVEFLAQRVGIVLLVLGAMHFLNLYVFHRLRRGAALRRAPYPVAPDRVLGTTP
jgi:hypothetical protein